MSLSAEGAELLVQRKGIAPSQLLGALYAQQTQIGRHGGADIGDLFQMDAVAGMQRLGHHGLGCGGRF